MADEMQAEKAQETKTETETPSIEELKAEISNLKKAISASNADAAKRKKESEDWKSKYESTLDEQKKKEFAAEETLKQLKAENEQFKTEKRIADYSAKLMGVGYDQTTASAMASTLPEGIPDSFFESQKTFIETTKQTLKAQTLNSQPNLPVGQPPSSADAMSALEASMRKQFGL